MSQPESPARRPLGTLAADVLLLTAAVIWGTTFVAQKLATEHMGPVLFNGTRYALGAAILLPFALRRWRRIDNPRARRDALVGGALAGVAMSLGSTLQQVGMHSTSVSNAGFITGLYVIMVPLIGLLVGQRTGLGTWLGASLAVVGMFLLSVGENFQVASGDWLQLAGAVVWGVHVLMIGSLARRHDPLRLAVLQFAACGVISLLLALVFEEITLPALLGAGPAILYGALIGVAIGFTLQVIAQRDALSSHAAVIFSLEAVFAALAGAWFLDEMLQARGYVGCGLMFAGMLVAQLWPRRVAV
jgi:drug/metabolite transporter (DMT)-like permease